jgi:hypothetical protein
MPTLLAFNTPAGAAVLPTGTRVLLGTVNVSAFEEIRVLIVSRPGYAGNVGIILEYTIGGWTPAWLDVINVATLQTVAKNYRVPGIELRIHGDVHNVTSGLAAVDVLVFGFSPK